MIWAVVVFSFLTSVWGLKVPTQVKTILGRYSKIPISVIEPVDEKPGSPCVFFLTGGSTIIPYDLYSNLLHEIASHNITVFLSPEKEIKTLIETVSKNYSEIVPVSHSSGIKIAIDQMSRQSRIKKWVALDPVDTRIFKLNPIVVPHIKDFLILNAVKSYTGKPIPFIPEYFQMYPESFRLARGANVTVLEREEFGHCDVLNPFYSDLIYNTKVCDGLDRQAPDYTQQKIYDYHKWLAKTIVEFINPYVAPAPAAAAPILPLRDPYEL